MLNKRSKNKKVKTEKKAREFLRWLKPKELAQIGGIKKKSMSLIQLKETIEEIYDNKKIFDQKCKKNKAARESMEQYLYLFFKQRFGLNNIVIEWVTGLIESLRIYSSEDSDVALFALILRNEVDEEFANIQSQIKGTIEEILLNLIETNNPHKSKKVINKMMADKKKGIISESLALEIVNTMYTDEHPNKEEILIKLEAKVEEENKRRLAELASKKTNGKSSKGKKRKKKKESVERVEGIHYNSLVKIILDMQLKTHYGFLRNLSMEFRKFDDQNYGFISREQLRKLTNNFLHGSDILIDLEEMIRKRGTFDQSFLTFSDVVSMFSSKQIVSEGEEITMLQFIFELDQGINE